MRISVTYDNPMETGRSGPVTVGWLLTEKKGGIIYYPPERVRSVD